MRQPIGVCAAIAPFNFPGDGAAVVPAVRHRHRGNTFVLKPSEQVPLSQQRDVRAARAVRSAARRREPRQRRHARSSRRSAIIRHPRGVVRRIDAGRAGGLSARHARRQARAGARRRQELHHRDARRRSRSRDRDHHRVVLWLRGRALPGRQRARAGRRRASARRAIGSSTSARSAARSATAWSRAWQMGPVISGDASRPRARLHRQGRARGRTARCSTAAA